VAIRRSSFAYSGWERGGWRGEGEDRGEKHKIESDFRVYSGGQKFQIICLGLSKPGPPASTVHSIQAQNPADGIFCSRSGRKGDSPGPVLSARDFCEVGGTSRMCSDCHRQRSFSESVLQGTACSFKSTPSISIFFAGLSRMSKAPHHCARCGQPASMRIVEGLVDGYWTPISLALCSICDQSLRFADRHAWEWFRRYTLKSQ